MTVYSDDELLRVNGHWQYRVRRFGYRHAFKLIWMLVWGLGFWASEVIRHFA